MTSVLPITAFGNYCFIDQMNCASELKRHGSTWLSGGANTRFSVSIGRGRWTSHFRILFLNRTNRSGILGGGVIDEVADGRLQE